MSCLAASRQQNTFAWLYGDTLMPIFTSGQMRLILGENLYIFVYHQVSKFSKLCYVKGLRPLGCFSSERLEVNLILARFLAVFCWTFNPTIVNFNFYLENLWTSPTNTPNRFKYLRRRYCLYLFVCPLVFVCFFRSFVFGSLAPFCLTHVDEQLFSFRLHPCLTAV